MNKPKPIRRFMMEKSRKPARGPWVASTQLDPGKYFYGTQPQCDAWILDKKKEAAVDGVELHERAPSGFVE